jgi:hypothetical protein
MGAHLTNTLVKGLPTPATGYKITYDGGQGAVKGFGICVTAKGTKSFVLNYRIQGRERRTTIGKFPSWNAAAARYKAKQLRHMIDHGDDPLTHTDDIARDDIIRAKFQSFIDNNIEPACTLYRHYHPNGDLLYVGISLSVLRQNEHMHGADWRKQIHRIVLEPFATREQAIAAERLAIDTEFPKFNTVHNGRSNPLRRLARVMASRSEAINRSRFPDPDPGISQTQIPDPPEPRSRSQVRPPRARVGAAGASGKPGRPAPQSPKTKQRGRAQDTRA